MYVETQYERIWTKFLKAKKDIRHIQYQPSVKTSKDVDVVIEKTLELFGCLLERRI